MQVHRIRAGQSAARRLRHRFAGAGRARAAAPESLSEFGCIAEDLPSNGFRGPSMSIDWTIGTPRANPASRTHDRIAQASRTTSPPRPTVRPAFRTGTSGPASSSRTKVWTSVRGPGVTGVSPAERGPSGARPSRPSPTSRGATAQHARRADARRDNPLPPPSATIVV